jgi:CHAT domain-containing protein
MATLKVAISPADASPGWKASWFVDGVDVGSPITVDGRIAQGIDALARDFEKLFESDALGQSHRPLVEPPVLRAMGRVLFDTWFAPVWDTLGPRVRSGQHRLLIQSAEPAALNLPWELVELGDGLPLGCDAAWSLRRTSLPTLVTGGSLNPGPLRIVFLASAPLDLPQLDFEREEDAMLRATSRLGEDVVVYILDTGTFEELGDLVARIRPHIVHLSGHGSVDTSGRGAFAFEDERGYTDARDAADLATQIFRGSSVRCVVLNACETSQAATSGLCQALTVSGVPHAIGWAAPVVDDRATEFTEALYRRLAHGEPLSQAVAHARDTVRRSGALRHSGIEVQDATFALAQVYCSDDGAELYDRAAPARPWQGPRIVHELLGDGIKGLREGFVGRRRDVQRLVPPLRDGDVTFAVITGIGGAGKSTLATRAANRLAAAGFEVRPVRAAEGASAPERARLTLSKMISTLSDAFLKQGREDLHRLLTSGDIALDQRLRLAVDGLNELRLLIVLDNFEDCLDFDSRRITDPDLAECYRVLATRLTHGSRVIVTCRYFPEDTPHDQPQVKHVPLHDLDEPATLKFLRRDHIVENRLGTGELSWELIRDLHRALGGTPGFLVEVRHILESADADDLMDELHGDSAGPIASSRDEYFRRIVLQRLWDARSPAARGLAAQLALSELPLPADAVAALVDEPSATLAECSRYGLVSELPETDLPTLYAAPGLLRPGSRRKPRAPRIGTSRTSGRRASNQTGRASFGWVLIPRSPRAVRIRGSVAILTRFDGPPCGWHAALNVGLSGDSPTPFLVKSLTVTATLKFYPSRARSKCHLPTTLPRERTSNASSPWAKPAMIELARPPPCISSHRSTFVKVTTRPHVLNTNALSQSFKLLGILSARLICGTTSGRSISNKATTLPLALTSRGRSQLAKLSVIATAKPPRGINSRRSN